VLRIPPQDVEDVVETEPVEALGATASKTIDLGLVRVSVSQALASLRVWDVLGIVVLAGIAACMEQLVDGHALELRDTIKEGVRVLHLEAVIAVEVLRPEQLKAPGNVVVQDASVGTRKESRLFDACGFITGLDTRSFGSSRH
jgi:hypothetical protein